MFRRQKILLSLLDTFGGELSRKKMQKLLFLHCELNGDSAYSFVPYKYGCYSFQAAADHAKLITKGFLNNTEEWSLLDKSSFADALSYTERQQLWELRRRFKGYSQDKLIHFVYTSYPYYATRSVIAEECLNKEEMDNVESCRKEMAGSLIASIGYEGLSLETYLNLLINNDIKAVFDVRKNPLSRKFGFSKTILRQTLEHMGIEYYHVPKLGITSDKRKNLVTQSDYDALFDDYEKTTLKHETQELSDLNRIFQKKKRIALLCYEHLPEQCHRTRIIKAIHKMNKSITPVCTA
ncbi:MAG: DUF488 domain-containing protein [Kiritimatiellae bacterium]|jgi:hypothetical protein|nr:DUF488 domain-containing protein [Kiritimatiellia bacterium]